MPRALSTRERMIISTALLVRERGARATSIDDVLEHSGAPRGSVYHHFPGGRDQLLREATAYAGEFVAHRLTVPDGSDALATIDAFLQGYRADLIAGGFRAGCPVVAVAIESREDDTALVDEAAAVFARWEDLLAGSFTAAGVAPGRAHELALTVIASVEGALILCRARRDIAPLDAVNADLRSLLQTELAA
jgi:AcrR family transcriptional regulator